MKNSLEVKENQVKIHKIGKVNYISLTDIAKFKDSRTDQIIGNWLRNRNTIEFIGLWETLFNPNFKPLEFEGFRKEAGLNSFVMTPTKWRSATNAIGIISKSGKTGGTYAHPDIAFEFASWISPEFKLYLIKEFERLKLKESNDNEQEWNMRRELAKTNYKIHTSAVSRNLILPILTKAQINKTYANEADLLNVALFGLTAKEWKQQNGDKSGNMRDYASILELLILSNLEVINAELIKNNISSKERLVKLNQVATEQTSILADNSKALGTTNK